MNAGLGWLQRLCLVGYWLLADFLSRFCTFLYLVILHQGVSSAPLNLYHLTYQTRDDMFMIQATT